MTARAVRRATARAAGAQRTLLGLLGVLGVTAGAAALMIGSAVLGVDRAGRPVLDPIVLNTVRSHQALARTIAIAVGVTLLILGLLWATRALTPERRPNLFLDSSVDSRLEVSATAIADALRADAETIDGVSRARARMVGSTATPVVRLNLWLKNGTDIREVYRDLDTRVLRHARDSLGLESLAAAIRIELDTVAPERVI